MPEREFVVLLDELKLAAAQRGPQTHLQAFPHPSLLQWEIRPVACLQLELSQLPKTVTNVLRETPPLSLGQVFVCVSSKWYSVFQSHGAGGIPESGFSEKYSEFVKPESGEMLSLQMLQFLLSVSQQFKESQILHMVESSSEQNLYDYQAVTGLDYKVTVTGL